MVVDLAYFYCDKTSFLIGPKFFSIATMLCNYLYITIR